MNIHHNIRLSSRKLNIIRNIMHDYKDLHRGEPLVRLAMEVEAELQKQTGGDYQPDTTCQPPTNEFVGLSRAFAPDDKSPG